MSSICDTVLFLGAGFSGDADMPTMANFGIKAKEDHKGLLRHKESNDFREAAPLLIQSAKIFEAFQDYCFQSETVSHKDIDNMEKVFCIAEMMKETGAHNIKLEGNNCSINDILESIKLWLWKVYQQCPFFNSKRTTREDMYTNFFEIIKSKGIDKQLTVITTNYDLIYEYSSNKNGIKCCYPFSKVDFIEDIKVGSNGEGYVNLYENDDGTNPVLCKLHGSVNFFQNSIREDKDKLFVSSDLGDGKPIGGSGPWPNNWPAIFAVDAIWNIRNKYGKGFTPAVIPPTYAKLTQDKWLKRIWERALFAMSEAKIIIFIGYSMPVSDGFMESFVHASMILRKSKGLSRPEVIAIDPDEKVFMRYKKLFGGCFNDLITPATLSDLIADGHLEGMLT